MLSEEEESGVEGSQHLLTVILILIKITKIIINEHVASNIVFWCTSGWNSTNPVIILQDIIWVGSGQNINAVF